MPRPQITGERALRSGKAVTIIVVLVVAAAIGAILAIPRLSTIPPSSSAGAVTLGDLINGKFRSASDKAGTGGVTVTVTNLQVIYVRTESDGDWHVAVTDGLVSVFITEITPAYQSALGEPQAGSIIEETGFAYCDTFHEAESWHGNTCWEIHPVTSWHAIGPSGKTIATKANAGLQVSVSYGNDPIRRGSPQTITVQARDSDGALANAVISVEVDYASGLTSHTFSCTTSSTGSCSVTWTIGSTSTPGTFQVIVDAEGQEFLSSFTVTG